MACMLIVNGIYFNIPYVHNILSEKVLKFTDQPTYLYFLVKKKYKKQEGHDGPVMLTSAKYHSEGPVVTDKLT